MDNNYNSPELGSIFLIEERENKVVDVDEDRLLEADQSNISIYRIVFYAELFSFFLRSLLRMEVLHVYYALASIYNEGLYAEIILSI